MRFDESTTDKVLKNLSDLPQTVYDNVRNVFGRRGVEQDIPE